MRDGGEIDTIGAIRTTFSESRSRSCSAPTGRNPAPAAVRCRRHRHGEQGPRPGAPVPGQELGMVKGPTGQRPVELPLGGGLPDVRVQQRREPISNPAPPLPAPPMPRGLGSDARSGPTPAGAGPRPTTWCSMALSSAGLPAHPDSALQRQVLQTWVPLGGPRAVRLPDGRSRLGAPPGAGLRVDRMVMLLAGEESIRDTIAFPKTQQARCLMTSAPGAWPTSSWRNCMSPAPGWSPATTTVS
ncbi:MAG: hypothetical protein CM15mP116_08620 [Synechococcus sp.]|nr:MAG: hypothetical protein CM15mP116_08620 [Synechococcus sp.]